VLSTQTNQTHSSLSVSTSKLKTVDMDKTHQVTTTSVYLPATTTNYQQLPAAFIGASGPVTTQDRVATLNRNRRTARTQRRGGRWELENCSWREGKAAMPRLELRLTAAALRDIRPVASSMASRSAVAAPDSNASNVVEDGTIKLFQPNLFGSKLDQSNPVKSTTQTKLNYNMNLGHIDQSKGD
jgi:hypothetical protein